MLALLSWSKTEFKSYTARFERQERKQVLDVAGRRCATLKSVQPMADIVQIPVPLPHIKSVNAWLVQGEPLTLVDTGPYGEEAYAALRAGLEAAGTRVEDL